MVTGNIVNGSGSTGISVSGGYTTVTNNIVRDNGAKGIFVGSQCIVIGNTAASNGASGIYANSSLVKDKIEKVLLKPLMIVAGDHANNDMAGDEDDSWKTAIKAKGIEVITEVQGLGENPEVSKIFIQHIKDVAQDHQIDL